MAKRSNGEGTIFKRADGRWCAAYYVGTKRKFVYGKTQRIVKERLEQMKLQQEEIQHSADTVENWVLEYLENYKRNDLKASTYATYLTYYRKHIKENAIGKKMLSELSTADLQSYYNHMIENGLSAKTVRHLSVIVNEALQQAVRLHKIERNVNTDVILPKKEKYEGKILSKEEVAKLAKEAKGEKLYSLVMLTIFTGMRKGEVLGLTWDCVNLKQGYLEVKKSLCRVHDHTDEKGRVVTKLALLEPKNKSSIRRIPLSGFVVDVLREHYEKQTIHKAEWQDIYCDQNLVFANADGGYLSPRYVLEEYSQMLDRYSVKRVRFHDLRHTFASLLLENDTEGKVIQELLGHSSISTTMDIYSHISMGQKQKSVEKLENIVGTKI